MRIFTGKCSISQTGSGSGYIQVSITNFNDPGGQFDTTEIQAGDKVVFTDSGDIYQPEILTVISASGSSAIVRVDNTGLASVPTSTNAFVSRGSTNYNLYPFVANTSFNENQLFMEDTMVKIDDALDMIAGGGGGPTNLTVTGASSPYNINSSTGTGITVAAGSGITLSRVSNELTITASGGGGGATNLTFTGISPITLNSDTGTDVTFTAGTNISLTRTGNNMTVSAPSVIVGATDQNNGLDIAVSGNNIVVDYDLSELGTVTTFDANDKFLMLDSSSATHVAATGAYFQNGFVDKTSTQVDIGGDKGFTTSIHYGAASLPTSSNFGTTVGTNVYFAPTTTAITETNFNNSNGLIFHNRLDATTGYQTCHMIAAGNDGAGGKASELKFGIREAGGSKDWIYPMRIAGTQVLFGNGNTGSGVGGQIQLYASGGSSLAWLGGTNNWTQGTITSGTSTFYVAEEGAIRAHIDSNVNGWVSGSDERLKENIETLSVLPYIDTLRGVEYTMKQGGKRAIGVIAQEVEQHFSATCSLPDDPQEMKGVNYNGIAAIALQGVKELYEENKLLKEQIKLLSNRLDRLENI